VRPSEEGREGLSDPEDQVSPTGEVEYDGEYATLAFSRRVGHPPEDVWSAITDPKQLQSWYMTRAVIASGRGGSIDFISGPSHFHVTGRILRWDPPRLFEHEWKVEPRPELPTGEDSLVRWELARDGDGTRITLVHQRLTRRTATGFAPGTHAFLDRLAAQLDGEPIPDWMGRVEEVRKRYPSMWRPQSSGDPAEREQRT
jgi:uncharacterized protein YndB with AHSA1/START domain